MAPRKTQPKKGPFVVRSYSQAIVTETILKRLSQDATDIIGRTVSDSAILRALLRYANGQPFPWVREHLYPYIEEEMEDGTTWGKQRGDNAPRTLKVRELASEENERKRTKKM
jgi:hypothetical protein